MFADAITVKIRDGTVANRPVYLAVGVSLDGERDALRMWAGTGGEGQAMARLPQPAQEPGRA
jgi:transposase-like protein